jgi:Calcineurin-like phosphoesterase
VRTVVVSDLHLGVRAGNDVARRPEVRSRLAETVRGADRLVLLGDVFELRERPLEEIVPLARPLLHDLAAALAPAGEIVIVPGNHDHALVAPLAASVGGSHHLRSLEQRLRPVPPHPLGRLAEELAPIRVELAYPGLWLDRGVYAIHGHYLDVHSSVPMVEVLALAVSARLQGGRPGRGSSPADYERIATPVYRASLRLGRAGETLGRAGRGDFSIRMYERLSRRDPDGGSIDARRQGSSATEARSQPTAAAEAQPQAAAEARPQATIATSLTDLGDRILATAIPAGIAVLNRLGLGPFDPNLSGRALRRAGLLAMAEAVDRLGIEAEHVIFGHTHRAGPLRQDVEGWTIPARDGRPETRLLNTGNWVYTPAFLADRPHDSPYWPGRCAIVDEGSAPRLVHPLAETGHADLAG